MGEAEEARGERLADLVALASHLLNEDFARRLKQHGISATEWRVLAALAEHDGLTMSELARSGRFKQPTLTKAIDRMERAGLVRRRPMLRDRRHTEVFLARRGGVALAPLLAAAAERERMIGTALGDGALALLKAALRQLIARLAGPAGRGSDAPRPARTGRRPARRTAPTGRRSRRRHGAL